MYIPEDPVFLAISDSLVLPIYLLQEKYKTHTQKKTFYQKIHFRDFASGPVVKNPPYNSEDMGLIPSPETKIPYTWKLKIPYAVEQIKPMFWSLHTTIIKHVPH